jgi:tRNA(fMet)-specific endonuclease VapC
MAGGKLILDTNIVSYLLKNDALAQPYLPHLAGNSLYISFITVGELYLWAENNGWGTKRRADLETRLRNYIVIPYDHVIARSYGLVGAERRRAGKPISLNDAWIAACAVRHDVPLVTHNRKDFTDITALQLVSEAPA